jgi:hypothetical protein
MRANHNATFQQNQLAYQPSYQHWSGSPVICRDWQRGRCTRRQCRFQHV